MDQKSQPKQSKAPETARCGNCGSVSCCKNRAQHEVRGSLPFDQLYTTILGAVLTGASPQRWDKLVGEAWTLARKAEEQMKTPRNTDMP